jgi:hypothetical protein
MGDIERDPEEERGQRMLAARDSIRKKRALNYAVAVARADRAEEQLRIAREALGELAANRHSLQRPAGRIAREALEAMGVDPSSPAGGR